jgi:RNA polymerase sigma-70 factor (ECF subfamily)
MEEGELIRRAGDGDLDAFDELMKIYFPVVERFAYQLGNPVDSVDDITQEVFLRMYRYIHKYTRGKFTTWLYKLTLNVSRDMYRKRKSNANKFNRLKQRDHVAPATVEENVLKDEQDRDLHMLIQQLNDKYKVPLILFYFHEKNLDEIAEVLNIPVPTVKTRLSRAKKQLKVALKREEETPDVN